MNTNFAQHNLAHANMIEQQIRPWNVFGDRLLEALASINRLDFVSSTHQALAFSDLQLPLPHGQTMLSPKVLARCIDTLNIQRNQHVLEIGTGSGYGTALLAYLSEHVHTCDIHEDLLQQAKTRLDAAKLHHITFGTTDVLNPSVTTDLTEFDALIIHGALASEPTHLLNQMKPHSKLVCGIGLNTMTTVYLFEKQADGTMHQTSLFEAEMPALHGHPEPTFIF